MSSAGVDRSGGFSEASSVLDSRYTAEIDPACRNLQAPKSDLEHLMVPIQAKQIPLPQVSGLLKQRWSQLQELRQNQSEFCGLTGHDPEVARLTGQAFLALQAGARFSLEDAAAAFEQAYRRVRDDGDRVELAARIRAAQARIAAIQQEYARAGGLYEEAAVMPGLSTSQQWQYRMQQALALEEQGRECGDNAALLQAIGLLEAQVLALAPQAERPDDWAATQHQLGAARAVLGQRQIGTHLLDKALEALESALSERTREGTPLEWAATQDHLGITQGVLAQRCADDEKLEKSIAAFQLALEERTQERVPDDWAMTQNHLGTALLTFGRRKKNATILRQAADAYKNVLKVWTRDRVPLQWAATMDHLGMALRMLGEHRKGPRTLEQSVAAYRSALSERARNRVPQAWATTQNNLGAALHKLGERQQDAHALEAAVEAYGNALQEWTRDKVPMTWAMTMANRCAARKVLAELSEDVELMRRVLADFRAVGDVFRDASHAHYYELVTEQVALARKLEQKLGSVRNAARAGDEYHTSG